MTHDSDTVSTEVQSEPSVPAIRRVTTTALAVVAIAVAGGAAIYAATDHMGGGRHQPWHPPDTHGGPSATDAGHRANLLAIPDDSLHGEFVTAAPGGGYRTTLVQTGVITAISPQSVTMRSADGYTQTYALPPAAARGPVPYTADQAVTVRATRDGQVVTVTRIGAADTPAG